MATAYHALFGAGRLGLGLVLPALCSLNTPVVVFQRLSGDPATSEWSSVIGHDWVYVENNSTPVARLRCLLGRDDDVTDEELSRLLQDGTSLLVNCRSPSQRLQKTVLAKVRSCTAVVQPQDLPAIGECLSVCPSLHCKLFVVANDSKAVMAFADQLRAMASGIHVVPVSGDRICFTRKLERGRISIQCEQFPGSMGFFLDQSRVQDAYPFTPGMIASRKDKAVTISVARTPDDQTFYEERKANLLNGVHFVMAVLSYDLLLAENKERSRWGGSPLLEWQRSSTNAKDIDVFLGLHIHRLASKYGKDKADLREFADTVMKRILCTPDSVGRVLNLSDPARARCKYERYVHQLWLLCEQQQESEGSEVKELMQKGRVVLARLERKFDAVVGLGCGGGAATTQVQAC